MIDDLCLSRDDTLAQERKELFARLDKLNWETDRKPIGSLTRETISKTVTDIITVSNANHNG